jgi:hypothetical protein
MHTHRETYAHKTYTQRRVICAHSPVLCATHTGAQTFTHTRGLIFYVQREIESVCVWGGGGGGEEKERLRERARARAHAREREREREREGTREGEQRLNLSAAPLATICGYASCHHLHGGSRLT